MWVRLAFVEISAILPIVYSNTALLLGRSSPSVIDLHCSDLLAPGERIQYVESQPSVVHRGAFIQIVAHLINQFLLAFLVFFLVFLFNSLYC